MSCENLIGALPRISARRGQVVDLNVDFLHAGSLKDPYAVRYIEIYKSQVLPHNLVTTIPVVDPDDDLYPAPLCQDSESIPEGQCGTDPILVSYLAGKYHLPFTIPNDFSVPDVYFDVWYYYAVNPCDDGTDACDLESEENYSKLLKSCHRFWIYPDEWFLSDGLQTVRFGFEPLDSKFNSPELRPLEIGLMPLPLYDYNFNLVNPLIPYLQPSITIETQNCETLVSDEPCRIGLRQGSYRSNPWVIQYDLDTSQFLKGTYRYQIKLTLPNGTTRVSRKYIFVIM